MNRMIGMIICIAMILSAVSVSASEDMPVIYEEGGFALMQYGYRIIIKEGKASGCPLYLIKSGDISVADNAVNYYWRSLGDYALNGIRYVRYDNMIWKEELFIRPKDPEEFLSWIDDKEMFYRKRWISGNRLPKPYGQLEPEDLVKISDFIFYLDAGSKAYLNTPISRGEAIDFVNKLAALFKNKE